MTVLVKGWGTKGSWCGCGFKVTSSSFVKKKRSGNFTRLHVLLWCNKSNQSLYKLCHSLSIYYCWCCCINFLNSLFLGFRDWLSRCTVKLFERHNLLFSGILKKGKRDFVMINYFFLCTVLKYLWKKASCYKIWLKVEEKKSETGKNKREEEIIENYEKQFTLTLH